MWDAVWLVLRAWTFQDKIKIWLCHPTQSVFPPPPSHSFLRRKQVSSWHFIHPSLCWSCLPPLLTFSCPDTHFRVPTPGSPLPFSWHTCALLLFPLLSLEGREKRHKLPSSVPTVDRPGSWGQVAWPGWHKQLTQARGTEARVFSTTPHFLPLLGCGFLIPA